MSELGAVTQLLAFVKAGGLDGMLVLALCFMTYLWRGERAERLKRTEEVVSLAGEAIEAIVRVEQVTTELRTDVQDVQEQQWDIATDPNRRRR